MKTLSRLLFYAYLIVSSLLAIYFFGVSGIFLVALNGLAGYILSGNDMI